MNKPSFVSNITSSKEWFKNGSMHVWSLVDCKRYWQFATLSEREALLRVGPNMREKAGTKVGPDQLGPPVRVGSTRIDSDQLGSNKKIKMK